MTRLGDFLNFLVANFRTKAVQIFGDFLDYFYNEPYLPAAVTIFGQLLENFGLLFFLKTFGHTESGNKTFHVEDIFTIAFFNFKCILSFL